MTLSRQGHCRGTVKIRRCFCPSVCPSVRRVHSVKNPKAHVPTFGSKVPHRRCDSHTSFKVKRSKVKVTRPINADTRRAPYLPNGKAYELQTFALYRWRTTTRISHMRHDLQGRRLRSQGHVISLSLFLIRGNKMLYLCH